MALGMQLDRKNVYKIRVKYCLSVNCFKNGDCSNFSVITGRAISLRAGRPGVQIPAGVKDVSLLQGFRTNSRSQLSHLFNGYRGSFLGGRGQPCEVYALLSSAGISKKRGCISPSLRVQRQRYFNLFHLYIHVISKVVPVHALKVSKWIIALL